MRVKGKKGFNKVKHFSHVDLDGIGCVVITKTLFGDNVDAEMIDANKSSEIIDAWINKGGPLTYNSVIITDISVSPEVADRLESLGLNLLLLDHHATASNIADRSWCTVNDTVDWCGTNLTYQYFRQQYPDNQRLHNLERFVEEVHQYDNWLWVDNNDELANHLHLLLDILGKERFIDRFVGDPSVELTSDEKVLLMLELDKIRNYVFSRRMSSFKSDLTIENQVVKCVVTYAERYINDVAHDLLANNLDCDVAIVIMFPYTMSFRTRKNSPIDLTTITVPLGGGGHPASGGVPLDSNDCYSVFESMISSRGYGARCE